MADTVAPMVSAIAGDTKTTVEENKCGRVWAMLSASPASLALHSSCSRSASAFSVRQ
jgi:hypothetical protein